MTVNCPVLLVEEELRVWVELKLKEYRMAGDDLVAEDDRDNRMAGHI